MLEFDDESVAKNYDRFIPGVQNFLVPYIMQHLSERKKSLNETVDDAYIYDLMIDVGCGGGKSSNPYASRFRSVLGCDISIEQIKLAQMKKVSDNVFFEVAKEESIPAVDASADLITSCYAVHQMDFEKFFSECRRVIKPSGIIAIYGSIIKDVFLDNPTVNVNEETRRSICIFMSSYIDALKQRLEMLKHCDWHVLDRYQTLFQRENGFEKYRRDDLEVTEAMSLREFIKCLDYVPSFKKCNDEVQGKMRRPQQIDQKLRSFWNLPNVDGKDIKIKVVRSIYLLIFSW